MPHEQRAHPCANFTESDALLIALGTVLESVWAEETASGFSEEAFETGRAIVAVILRLPARTLEGLKVKVRAVEWCCVGELFSNGNTTTDMLLVDSILKDLSSIGKKESWWRRWVRSAAQYTFDLIPRRI